MDILQILETIAALYLIAWGVGIVISALGTFIILYLVWRWIESNITPRQ